MKVYLSGRMSGLPAEIWRARFYGAYFGLKHRGIRAVNPADVWVARYGWLWKILTGITSEHTVYRLTMWYDLQLLKRCTHFTMIGDDWQQSRGARLERLKARKWNIQEWQNYDSRFDDA